MGWPKGMKRGPRGSGLTSIAATPIIPCSKCGIEKPRSEFYKGRVCKVCQCAINDEYSALNPEVRKKSSAAYRERNREETNRRTREWAHKFPVRALSITHARRARLAKAEGSYTEQEWLDLCEKYNQLCAWCNNPKKLTVDHIIPISKGGSNFISNIQPLCGSCNSRKGNRLLTPDLVLLERAA